MRKSRRTLTVIVAGAVVAALAVTPVVIAVGGGLAEHPTAIDVAPGAGVDSRPDFPQPIGP